MSGNFVIQKKDCAITESELSWIRADYVTSKSFKQNRSKQMG